MGKFRDYISLLESPVAVIGDWSGFSSDLRIGAKGMKLDWTFEDTIKNKYNKNVDIYSSNNKYILGAWV